MHVLVHSLSAAVSYQKQGWFQVFCRVTLCVYMDYVGLCVCVCVGCVWGLCVWTIK